MSNVHYPPRSAQNWKSSVDTDSELPTNGNQLNDIRLKRFFTFGTAQRGKRFPRAVVAVHQIHTFHQGGRLE
jgi:hypothetical protein